MDLTTLTQCLHGGLIVSCQALADEPLFGSNHMAAMARAAVKGGAIAVRANGPGDIAAIRVEVNVPIIGLYKIDLPGYEVRITPTIEQAIQVIEAGADMVAIDATQRTHPGGTTADLIMEIHRHGNRPVLADVASLEEGIEAAAAGAEFVATTLAGYTSYSPSRTEPDFFLLEQLVEALTPKGTLIIAEGHINTPSEAARALEIGAHAVVVGSAITRPQWITTQFVEGMQKGYPG